MRDPRGPQRVIEEVIEVRTPCPEGEVVTVNLRLSCGHVRPTNPTFMYWVGHEHRCFVCSQGEETP